MTGTTDRISDSFSVYAFPERWRWVAARRTNPTSGLFTNDFIQSAAASVIPPSIRRDGPVKAELSPSDPLLARAVGQGISGRRHDLSSAVWDFSHDAALAVLTFGSVPYEVFFGEVEGQPSFNIAAIPPWSVVRFLSHAFQFIPGRRLDRSKGHWVRLPSERLVWLRLPFRRRRQLARVLRALSWHDSHIMPDLKRFWSDPRGQNTLFNSEAFLQDRREALGVATRELGWSKGSEFAEVTTEYYRWVRQLRYQTFLIDLRDEILKTLNKCLQIASPQLGQTCEVTLHGLPSREDVTRAAGELRAGSRPFSEVFSFIQY